MLSTRQTTFEVQLCRDGRWIIAAQCDGHHEAQALALRLLGERDPEGVRVIRDTVGADMLHKEKVVFQKMNDRPTARQEPTVIGPIASAPVCPDLHAFYETESRLVMGRLFRRYLDAVVLTPTEILHAYRPLRRLMDRDTLFASAVDRVASLQAKASGEPFRSRREVMFKAAHDLVMRARRAESRTLPAVAELGIDATVRALTGLAEGREHLFLARTAVSRALIDTRTWWGKLKQLLSWFDACEDPVGIAVLDDVLADVLANPAVIQDLLGRQPNLGRALLRLSDLAEGRFADAGTAPPGDGADQRDMAAALDRLLAAGRLPAGRAALLDHVRHALAGARPLTADARTGDQAAFAEQNLLTDLLNRLIPDSGEPVGGAAIAEAVTDRAMRLLNRGGNAGRRQAIREIMLRLTGWPARLRYLLALAGTPTGRACIEDIAEHVEDLADRLASIDGFAPGGTSPVDRMRRATALHNQVLAGDLPEAAAARLADRIDRLLADYLDGGRVLAQFNDLRWSLRIRAFALITLCQPDVLPDGRSRALARRVVLEHLRRPAFEHELVADIADPAEREQTLRRFHALLLAADFG